MFPAATFERFYEKEFGEEGGRDATGGGRGILQTPVRHALVEGDEARGDELDVNVRGIYASLF